MENDYKHPFSLLFLVVKIGVNIMKTFLRKLTHTGCMLLFSSLTLPAAVAGPLNLSDNALEVITNVEPNIMILHDDSGSMDWGIMTDESEGGTFHIGDHRYKYTHPDPGASGSSPAENDDEDRTVPTEEFLSDLGVAAPQSGVWRAWNHNYNKIYYNPNITYTPWVGVNKSGNAYSNVLSTAAPYDPYDPSLGNLDLTNDISYQTRCELSECESIATLDDGDHLVTVTDFYPARYYTWSDENLLTPSNASNSIVDADDSHSLVEITPATTSYTRSAYNSSTGIGRNDCTNNGDGTATCDYAQEIQNFANWFSYYRKRDLLAKASFSKVIEPLTSARVGYATINNNASNSVKVASMNASATSGAKRILLDNIFAAQPDNSTPLRSALDKTGKYFECVANDIFGSSASSAPGSADCPVLAAPAGQCQANYTIVISDGYWNTAVDPGVGNTDSGSGDFDGGAFADTYSNTLADVAMHYYERDLHTLDNEVPTSTRDIAGYSGSTDPFTTMHQHMSLYGVGFGITGTLSAGPSDMSAGFSWPDPTAGDLQKVDDLRHATVNGRGLFVHANDSVDLKSAMASIINDIKSNSGTATAVAFNTQEVEAGTLVFRASFNTKTSTGNLVAQHVNPDGTVDSSIVWSAASQLDSKVGLTTDTRTIVTYKDTGSSTSVGVPLLWGDLTSGAGSQRELLDAPQPANIAAADNTFSDERVAYLRGQSSHEGPNGADGEFRERLATAGKLGDIVHSTPVFVGKPQYIGRDNGAYPSEKYSTFINAKKDRTKLVYVGANDGMLHAFNAETGQEHFAYVPNMVIQKLSNLTDQNYTHEFFVDEQASVNDIFFTPARGTNAGTASWNTVIVGGLGKGGKGYYGLNVTNPDDLDTQTEAAQNVLWEFTEADDGGVGNSDLGYSYSRPLIAMSNSESGGEKRWVAIFGNGYNSSSVDGDAHLYIVFIEGGQDGVWTEGTDFIKINTGKGKFESADGTTPNGIGGVRGIDNDGNGTVDYIYAGDLQGNLYRFDLRSVTASDWNTTPALLFQAYYRAGSAFPRDEGTRQPITKRPIVAKHPTDTGYVVIAATGSWMTDDDTTDYSTQSIYGIWDDLTGTPEVTMSSVTNQLVEQVFTNHVSTEHGFTVRTLTNNPVNWLKTGSETNKVKGWYIDLDTHADYAGERAVRNLQMRGGIVFVNTVVPRSTTACSIESGGFELAFDPFTGGPGTKPIFDLDGNGSFNANDNAGDIDSYLNIVTGIRFDDATPTDAAFIGHHRMTQAGNEIRSLGTNTKVTTTTGRTSWREIE
jgi:type IV pilus assembly protein PilY1